MKFNNVVTVTGAKKSVGEFEGKKFDSTTVFLQTDLQDRDGSGVGTATTSHKIGTSSAEFVRFANLKFPFQADAEFEMVTTGKEPKMVLVSLVPKAAKAA